MNEKENEEIKWYLRPTIVVVLLFFVMGPFALPLLYKSPKFSKRSKTILSILVVIYTAYLIFLLVKTGRESYKIIKELQDFL